MKLKVAFFSGLIISKNREFLLLLLQQEKEIWIEMETIPKQLSLFDQKGKPGHYPPPLAQPKKVTGSSNLTLAMSAYAQHLEASGYSPHTVRSFLGDLKLLKEFLGNKPVGDIGTQDLDNFLSYLRQGKMETPKSLSRRVTSLKNFFSWLCREKIIHDDPAARLIYPRAVSPLPIVLFESECQQILKEASKDPRDYVLVLVLLEAGLKREELLSVKVGDIDISNRYRPEIWVRGSNPYKERRLALPAEFTSAFEDYLKRYQIDDKLFPFTERNLNYILESLAQRAGVKKRISCQVLRDTFAVRQLKAGEDIDTVFKKLGLAPVVQSQEAKERYKKLAGLVL